jgi:WD40 repeat protein/uncharacterized caspase-like protein
MKNIQTLFLLFFVGFVLAQEPRLVLPVGHTHAVLSAVFSPDGKLVLTASSDKTARLYEVSTGRELQVLSGHTNEVYSAVFSPDCKLALTASADKTARIFDVATGKELKVLSDHTGWVKTAVFSSDGKLALTASSDNTARIYEVATGKELQVLGGHTGSVNSAVFSPDGKLAITASWDSTSRIYEVASGKELKVSRHTNWVRYAKFSLDGKLALTKSTDSTRIWEVSTGKMQVLRGHTNYIYSALFSPDGKLVLTASDDSTARIYEVSTGKELKVLNGHTNIIESAVFSPDGKLALTASWDSTSRIYEVATGKELKVLGHTNWVRSAKFSLDGKLALTIGSDRKLRIFEVTTGKELQVLGGYTQLVHSAVFSSDGKLAITASSDSTARIFEVSTGKDLQILSGHENTILSAVYSPDGKFALTASKDQTARIYEVSTGKVLQVLRGHTNWVYSAVFSPDGKLVLTTSRDNTARIFDVTTGKELQALWHTGRVYSAVFSPDGKLAITASWGDSTRIWEVSTGKLRVLNGHTKYINSAAFSPDGKLALTASDDKTARIYDVSTGKELQVLSGHTNEVYSAVFSPDCKLALTASRDQTARIYEVSTGRELQVLSNHKSEVSSAVFSPDGKLALVHYWDNTSYIYEISTGNELKVFCGHTQSTTSEIFSLDNKYIITTGSDHKTILWDVLTGKQLYTRLQLKNNDWLVYDEHHRYDGTQGARDYLYFVCGLEVVDLAQVKDALFVPNLVQRIMNGENLEHLPKLKDLEICGVTPEVEQLDNKNDGGYYYQIKSRKGGIGQVEIYINGMLRQTLESKTLTQKDGIYELKVDEKLIAQYQLVDKETEIKVIARTADNKISSRGAISSTAKKIINYRKPDLHAVMVGIDDYKGEGLDLNYAAKDAIDLQTALESSTKKFFNSDDTNRVHFYNLTVNRAGTIGGLTPDRNNILQTIDKIAKNSKPEDVLLLFFAGHGEVNKDNNFMLLTADASKEQAPNYMGISMKELLEKLTKVPAGKRVLILDACHSGAAINELNLKDIAGLRDGEDSEKQSQRLKELENLASKSGLAIITASSSDQKAMELPQYEHGLMTYALLTTMMNEPMALDKNNNLQLEDWLRETERAVAKLIENQSAQRFVPINFSLGKVDDEVRKSIDLRETPTIMIANVMNRMSDDDDLDIKSILKKLLSDVASRGTDKILLAEKDNEKAFSINISYELIEDKIESRVSIKKNKAIVKQFNYNGLKSNLKDFVKGLGEEILKIVRG